MTAERTGHLPPRRAPGVRRGGTAPRLRVRPAAPRLQLGRRAAAIRPGPLLAPPAARAADAAGLIAGALADLIVADPRRGHPVAAFGRAAAAVERRLYADSRARGVAYTAVCAGTAAGLGVLADRLTRGRPAARAAITAATTWAVLGGTTLGAEAAAMARALRAGDLNAARAKLPHLCGRDPAGLDDADLARATVESVAENTSDAVVAPLFWAVIAGPAGLAGYRAINTLDAMVGHRDAHYRNFGWASARLDDVANWVPARLTALLAAACAPLAGGSATAAYATVRRDGAAHPSPNAGRCEAAFAGALGVGLGGVNVYRGRVETRPRLGDGPAPGPRDIIRAVRLSGAVTAAAVAGAAGLTALRGRLPGGSTRRDRGDRG